MKLPHLLLIVNRKWLIGFLAVFLFTIFNLLFTFPAFAATTDCEPPANPTSEQVVDQVNRCAIEKNIFDDKLFNLNQISGTADSLYTLLLGESKLHPEITQVTQRQGALASAGRIVAMLYENPPASGISYMAYEIRKFNPIQPAYAETGQGYTALSPIQNIWQNFRNASYIGFVIVFVIVGFMIMFRAHISPQAVASVQDSLPRIVIALILVTFSYAIAGFMIDMMFVLINFMITIIPVNGTDANKIFTGNVMSIMSHIWDDIAISGGKAFGKIFQDALQLPGLLDDIIGFFGGLLAGLVFAIAALYVTFRIFFMLLVSYVTVIVLTIFAPFFFLVQALPGQNGGREWFKQIAANLSVFVTISIMFVMAAYLAGIGYLGGSGNPITQGASPLKFPLLVGGLDLAAIGKVIGFGFIFFAPEAAKMVKDWITTGKAQAPGGSGALAGGLAGAGALAGGAGKAAWNKGPVGDYRQLRQQQGQTEREYRGGLRVDELIKKGKLPGRS